MASMVKDPKRPGKYWVQFVCPETGKRRTLRTGLPKKGCETVKWRVEQLIASRKAGVPWEADLADWVANLGRDLADRLAGFGLIPKRELTHTALGEFLDAYIASRLHLKPNTIRNFKQSRRHLLEYFTEAKRLQEITAGDAEEWRAWMIGKGVSDATVSREVKRARQFFRFAVRKKLIPENPFVGLPSPQQVNKSREYFVSREQADAVLDACPDAEWQLLFALARFGGLRVPSEVLALKWEHVDWDRRRIRIPCPKLEHLDGHAWREIPLFPELRPYLDQARQQAEPGAVWVIARYRRENVNLRSQLERIIEKAGLKPWPRLFQNLRSTRETELSRKYPIHTVCAWIGNSPNVAHKHYLQVTDADFEQAAEEVTSAPAAEKGAAKSEAVGAEKALQKAKQQAAEGTGNDPQETRKPHAGHGVTLNVAGPCWSLQETLVPPRGVGLQFRKSLYTNVLQKLPPTNSPTNSPKLPYCDLAPFRSVSDLPGLQVSRISSPGTAPTVPHRLCGLILVKPALRLLRSTSQMRH